MLIKSNLDLTGLVVETFLDLTDLRDRGCWNPFAMASDIGLSPLCLLRSLATALAL